MHFADNMVTEMLQEMEPIKDETTNICSYQISCNVNTVTVIKGEWITGDTVGLKFLIHSWSTYTEGNTFIVKKRKW